MAGAVLGGGAAGGVLAGAELVADCLSEPVWSPWLQPIRTTTLAMIIKCFSFIWCFRLLARVDLRFAAGNLFGGRPGGNQPAEPPGPARYRV